MLMSQWRELWGYCVSGGVPRRSFAVALVVGTILNLINQGDALLSGAPLDFTKIILTFAVPYCVATYGAVSYRLQTASAHSASQPKEDNHAAAGTPSPGSRSGVRRSVRSG
jgi:hypothetical protein